MELTPIKQQTVLSQVMTQIKNLFIMGELAPGDRVPPEGELVAASGQLGGPRAATIPKHQCRSEWHIIASTDAQLRN